MKYVVALMTALLLATSCGGGADTTAPPPSPTAGSSLTTSVPSSTSSATTTSGIVPSSTASTSSVVGLEIRDVVIDRQVSAPKGAPPSLFGIASGGSSLVIVDLESGNSATIDLETTIGFDSESSGADAIEVQGSSGELLIWVCCEPGVGSIHRLNLESGVASQLAFGVLGEGTTNDLAVLGFPLSAIVAGDELVGRAELDRIFAPAEQQLAISLSDNNAVALVAEADRATLVWLAVRSIDDISETTRIDLGSGSVPGLSVALDSHQTVWIADGSPTIEGWTEDGMSTRIAVPSNVQRTTMDSSRRYLLIDMEDDGLAWLDTIELTGGVMPQKFLTADW